MGLLHRLRRRKAPLSRARSPIRRAGSRKVARPRITYSGKLAQPAPIREIWITYSKKLPESTFPRSDVDMGPCKKAETATVASIHQRHAESTSLRVAILLEVVQNLLARMQAGLGVDAANVGMRGSLRNVQLLRHALLRHA